MIPRFALAIPHTPWVPARVESMARLINTLRSDLPRSLMGTRKVFDEKAANWEWSEKLWQWAVDQRGPAFRCTHLVQLQDDVIPHEHFFELLEGMIGEVPKEVVCLETIHPASVALASQGIPWMTTSDGMVGVGYVVPLDVLGAFLEWRSTALKPGALQAVNEDTLLGVFCLATGRKIWSPIPTILDHDVSLASTYGNDAHTMRRPLVRANEKATPEIWRWGDAIAPPHFGHIWGATAKLALRWVKDFTRDKYDAAMADDGKPATKRLGYSLRAQGIESATKLLVCVPVKDRQTPECSASIWNLVNTATVDPSQAFELEDIQQWDADVVRVRSRFVNIFRKRSQASHMLFVDADVSFAPDCVVGMIRAGKDLVCAPYPAREGVDFARVKQFPDFDAEALAYHYKVRLLPGHDGKVVTDESGCVEVESIGLGLALISRKCIEDMAAHYGKQWSYVPNFETIAKGSYGDAKEVETALAEAYEAGEKTANDLTFNDVDSETGTRVESFAPFLFRIDENDRTLPSEDFAFCQAWRRMGGKVFMYLGPGSPVDHHGNHHYKGHLGAFGLRRA
jgi:hypothetical protein